LAYKALSRTTEEHAFRRIETDIAKDLLPSLVLLFGKEQFLVKWATDVICTKYVMPGFESIDLVKLDGLTVTAEELAAHCETFPFGLKKVVCLENAAFLSAEPKGVRGPKLREEDIIKLTESIPETCILIISAEKADKRKKFYKSISAKKGAYEFTSLDRQHLRAFVEGRFDKAGKSVSLTVLGAFIDLTGYLDKDSESTLYQIENDINKIIAYSESEAIQLSDVTAVVNAELNMNVFALSDAVSRGRKGEALQLLHNMLTGGENVYKILALLFSQFDLLLCIRDLLDRGYSRQEIQKTLDVNEYRLRMAMEQAGRFSSMSLRNIVRRAYAVDKNIKTGLLRDALALEMLIFEME
jgi:DNA polymerase-3 subunit delta